MSARKGRLGESLSINPPKTPLKDELKPPIEISGVSDYTFSPASENRATRDPMRNSYGVRELKVTVPTNATKVALLAVGSGLLMPAPVPLQLRGWQDLGAMLWLHALSGGKIGYTCHSPGEFH